MASTAIPPTLYRITSSQHCRLQAQEAAPCAQFARGQTSGSLRLPSRGAAAAGRGRTGSAISRRRLATVAATGTNVAADAEVDLYGLLGHLLPARPSLPSWLLSSSYLPHAASLSPLCLLRALLPALLSASLSLQYHPDVNSDPGAADTFIQLSNAYEVLVDEEQRALYDRFGAAALSRDFMAGRAGTERKGAAWEAFDTWDEFQPFQRKTRKGDARQAAAARWSSDSESEGEGEGEAEGGVVEAVTGDVVEYPLSAAVRDRFDDGRIKGVGFVVGRNKDRGDRHKLPPENLGLVEIEPLFQEAGEDVWQTDALESAAFASLPDLRVLRTPPCLLPLCALPSPAPLNAHQSPLCSVPCHLSPSPPTLLLCALPSLPPPNSCSMPYHSPCPPCRVPCPHHACGQEFDKRTDSWRILDALSPGCGSPVYDEEIIV
ncbi:unnamed protein product [Closterium sp. Naga37s-1]|nr:unnamed protein product [Closterium sp. Naga37s-1]